MARERRQFRILFRDFLVRILDLELLSSRGEIQRLLGQFAAMLSALSLTVAIYIVPRYGLSTLPWPKLIALARLDEEFLIGTTMAIAGLFTVLAWNTVLPDRRDCLILGLLPVRARTIFLAKLAAVGATLGVSIAAVNSFTGLTLPMALAPPGASLLVFLRFYGAWWLTMAAAGLLVCCGMLAIQSLAAQLLPYRVFLKLSSFLQMGAFFAILGLYFLKPPFPNRLPSTWFVGLYYELSGAGDFAGAASLAAKAVISLLIVVPLAAAAFALAFHRNARRIIEQPDIAPQDRSRPAMRVAGYLAAKLLRRPLDRAILLFTARTVARSRHHRLLLAAYGGIGLAIALAYARDLLYGPSSYELMWRNARWNQPNAPLLVGSFVLLFFAIIGARGVFALPIALPANWIFRITAIESPAAYFAAVRKSLGALSAVPVWIASAILCLAIWPTGPALRHLAIMAAAAALMLELFLHGFRKLPFACSYLPGKANLQVRLGLFAIGFVFVASVSIGLELGALQNDTAFAVMLAVLVALAVWAHRRTNAFAAVPGIPLQFDDQEFAEITTLDIRREGALSIGVTGAEDPVSPGHRPSKSRFITLSAALETPPPQPFSIRVALEQLLTDLQYGVRVLFRAPGFSVAAIAMIALGLGWNTTIYSIVHSILSKPAPGISADGLVSFGVMRKGRLADPGENSYPEYLHYAANSRSMQSITATRFERFNMMLADGSTYRLRGMLVTTNYFETLRVHLAMGRPFTEDESRGAAPLAAIITYPIWQTQFRAAPDILGQTVMLNGYSATIVGIAPPHFHGATFAPNLEVCVPLVAYARVEGAAWMQNHLAGGIEMYGRLADGASLSSAQAEFDGLSQRLQSAYPQIERGKRVVLAPYSATAFGPNSGRQARLFLAIVMAVALLTLVIVCANVANLMLARAIARQREVAIRLSMGASGSRLLRMLFAEGLALSLTAAGAAWLFANWATRALTKLLPPLESGAQFDVDFTPDWRVAAYALALALVGTLAFTIGPALRARRQALLPSLKAGEHGVIHGRSKLACALVVAQLTLCVILLIGGGLAWRSLSLINTTDLGFNRDHVLLAGVNFSGVQQPELLERLRQRLRALPGIVSVSWAIAAPPHSHPGMAVPVRAAGADQPVPTDVTLAGPDYLRTLGVGILAGRDFSPADRDAAIITRKLAMMLWPNQQAVGRTVTLGQGAQPLEVVGVVPDAAFNAVGQDGSFSGLAPSERRPFLFIADQDAPQERTLHIRYTGNLASLVSAVRAAIRQADPRLSVFSVRTMEAEWRDFTSPIRAVVTLLTLFAIGSLALGSIGLYAVTAFYTARRTREFGIRMALGATPRQTLRAVLQESLLLTAVGLAIGLAICAVASRALTRLLFGISPTDAVTYATTTVVLAAVSLLASYVPARRAARVDPLTALRED